MKEKEKIVFGSFRLFAEYSLIKENIPKKLKDLTDHSVGKSFTDLLIGAATETIEPRTLQSTCNVIERLLVHKMAPMCERCTVKRDFKNKKRNIFCVTRYRTPFPDEIKRMENSVIEQVEEEYNLKIRFGSLTKE